MPERKLLLAVVICAVLAIGLALVPGLWAQPPAPPPQPNKPVPWEHFLTIVTICGLYGLWRLRRRVTD